MSKHGARCVHCGQYHGDGEVVCPWTRKPLPRPQTAPEFISSPPSGGAGDEAELVGRLVGEKYEVRAVLGRGGMGTIYEAVHVQMGRAVALKVLHPAQVKRSDSVKRFHQEARAAGAIGHPNICEVYDIGTLDDGRPYLVMERLTGSTLARHLRRGVMQFDAAIDIITQVLSGLVVAHEKGIVHRDLKPDNIFLTERVGCPPVAKVLDFGVSKIVSMAPLEPRDADLDLTRTGMVMGTPYYMSPEQASGARDLDGRVDLYACGVILYEALTGRRPFVASTHQALLWNIMKTEPTAPSKLRKGFPSALESVIARAMARDRALRYGYAHEFIAALMHVRTNLPHYSAMPLPIKPLTPAAFSPVAPRPAVPKAPSPRDSQLDRREIDDLIRLSLAADDRAAAAPREEARARVSVGDRAAASRGRGSGSARVAPPPLVEADPDRTEVSVPPELARRVEPTGDETIKMDGPPVPAPPRQGRTPR
jgi:serine/threonine protein kinase